VDETTHIHLVDIQQSSHHQHRMLREVAMVRILDITSALSNKGYAVKTGGKLGTNKLGTTTLLLTVR
jgi:hypothetical protein